MYLSKVRILSLVPRRASCLALFSPFGRPVRV